METIVLTERSGGCQRWLWFPCEFVECGAQTRRSIEPAGVAVVPSDTGGEFSIDKLPVTGVSAGETQPPELSRPINSPRVLTPLTFSSSKLHASFVAQRRDAVRAGWVSETLAVERFATQLVHALERFDHL